MFDHSVAKAIIEGHSHSIREAERFGPAGDAFRQARRRPIRGFVQRLAARIQHRPVAPARPPQVGVGATQVGG